MGSVVKEILPLTIAVACWSSSRGFRPASRTMLLLASLRIASILGMFVSVPSCFSWWSTSTMKACWRRSRSRSENA